MCCIKDIIFILNCCPWPHQGNSLLNKHCVHEFRHICLVWVLFTARPDRQPVQLLFSIMVTMHLLYVEFTQKGISADLFISKLILSCLICIGLHINAMSCNGVANFQQIQNTCLLFLNMVE